MSQDDIDTIIDLIGEIPEDDFASIERIRQSVVAHPAASWARATPQRPVGRSVPNEAGFVVGDEVEFGDSVSPRYLIGRKGMIVVKTNAKSVKVTVPNDPGFGRFAGKQRVGCPNSIIRKSTPES